jgi:putative DNA primase/helicase
MSQALKLSPEVERILRRPDGASDRTPSNDSLLWSYPLTDLGNAERLIHLHGEDLRFCHPWRKWLVWDGRRFRIDATAELVRRAKDTTRRMWSTAAALSDPERRDRAIKHSRETEKHARIRSMIELAAAEVGVPVLPEQLDSDPWLLNVPNGTLDLRKGTLREHRREDLITKLCPAPFDPTAECANWRHFQKRVTNGSAELMSFKQRAIGYALTGAVSEKRSLFIYHGPGNNGKTTELEVLREVFGDYAGQMRIESITEQRRREGNAPSPDIADLRGLRFVVSSEPSEGQRLAENTVKYLTGMGRISARHLHQENFEFQQTWKIFMDCNHKPVIRGSDAAIWNRIGLIPFEVTIPDAEIDPELPAKLRNELSGILAWAVDGCATWKLHGLNAPASVQSATSEYRHEMDVIARFIEDCCVLADWSSAQGKMLYQAYQKWCAETGENALNLTNFGTLISKRGGISKTHVEQGVKYRGIGLRADPS